MLQSETKGITLLEIKKKSSLERFLRILPQGAKEKSILFGYKALTQYTLKISLRKIRNEQLRNVCPFVHWMYSVITGFKMTFGSRGLQRDVVYLS